MLLRLFINDYVHRYSRIITESVKEDTKMAFVHNLRLAGVISPREECEEVRILADFTLSLPVLAYSYFVYLFSFLLKFKLQKF
jgi:hypothetical protein